MFRHTLNLKPVPAHFRAPARRFLQKLLRAYPDTLALIVIGSVADGTWEKDSDLDVVWVYRGRGKRNWQSVLEFDYDGPVELAAFSQAEMLDEFRQGSTMAHAVRAGLAIYDPKRRHERWARARLGSPSKEWIDKTREFFLQRLEWGLDLYRREIRHHGRFCQGRVECDCRVSEILTRSVLNLARLLLVLRADVPMSKHHMRTIYPRVIRGRRLRRAVEITLRAHHEKRETGLGEAREIAYLGRWVRIQLPKKA